MKTQILSRLAKLEELTRAKAIPMFRYGWLKPLPKDFVGEKHVAITKSEPMSSPNFEWCEFEERPGPVPKGSMDDAFTVTLSRDETQS